MHAHSLYLILFCKFQVSLTMNRTIALILTVPYFIILECETKISWSESACYLISIFHVNISLQPIASLSSTLCPLSSTLCSVPATPLIFTLYCIPLSFVLCPLSCNLCPLSSVLCLVTYVLTRYERPILLSREPHATKGEITEATRLQKELSTIVNEFILKRGNTLNAQHLPPKLVRIMLLWF